jgi:hypothetical protein
MSKASDLLTVSVGRVRLAWVRANQWPASAAMQRAIDEAMAGPSPAMPQRVSRRRVRVAGVFRRLGLYDPGVIVFLAESIAAGKAWDKLRPHMWVARAPAAELPRLIDEAVADGRVVTTLHPEVLLMAVRPAVEAP